MNTYCKITAFAVIGALAAVASAQNASGPATGNLYISGYVGQGWAWSYVSGVPGGPQGYGGPFSGSYQDLTGDPNAIQSMPVPIMYCTSIVDEFSPGQTFAVEADPAPSAAGWLVDNIIATTAAQTTGLQLAIWSVLNNPAQTIIPAPTWAEAVALGDQQTFLNYHADLLAWYGAGSPTALAYNFNYVGEGQPQIAPIGTPTLVPNLGTAPGPAAVIPFGLGLVGKLRRRNKSRKA